MRFLSDRRRDRGECGGIKKDFYFPLSKLLCLRSQKDTLLSKAG